MIDKMCWFCRDVKHINRLTFCGYGITTKLFYYRCPQCGYIHAAPVRKREIATPT